MDARFKPGHDAEGAANLFRPHGEERCVAARLEPCGRPILRDAALRAAPQDEADESCGVWIPGPALKPVPGRREAPIRVRRPGMTKEHVVITGLVPSMTTTSQALRNIIKIKYVLTPGNCRSF
jgi:hypothetical protein